MLFQTYLDNIEYTIFQCRSSRLEVFCKKGVLKDFTKFTEKHLCQSLFLSKVAGLRPVTLLKKRLWHRCFPVNYPKFLRTPFFTEHLWWLLLLFLISERIQILFLMEKICVCVDLTELSLCYRKNVCLNYTTVIWMKEKDLIEFSQFVFCTLLPSVIEGARGA